MSAIYDNWEKLVAAVLKKEQLWQLFHSDSVSPSFSSDSSGFSFVHLISSLDDVPVFFSDLEWHASDDFGARLPTDTCVAGDLDVSTSKNDEDSRKRDLKIQVPESQAKCADDVKRRSCPLPLPPGAKSAAESSSQSRERAENVESPWKKGKLLGKGSFGEVYVGFNSEQGGMCAMKEIPLSSEGEKERSARMKENEIALLSRMNHPNIVRCYGSKMVADKVYIYYEYMSRGSIFMILEQYGGLGESAIRNYTQQILSGLAYLHSISVTHGNIKGASILIDPKGSIKLTNFGIEKQIRHKYTLENQVNAIFYHYYCHTWFSDLRKQKLKRQNPCSNNAHNSHLIAAKSQTSWMMDSPYWTAPEVILNPDVSTLAIDIWSLGCTILEMATSKPPLSQYDGAMAMFRVAYHKELPAIPHHLSADCKDFLRQCLQWNPLHRATASQLLEHPFVKCSSPLEEKIPSVANFVKNKDNDRARNVRQLDSEKVVSSSMKASKSDLSPSLLSSPLLLPAHLSPLTPRSVLDTASPLYHPRTPQPTTSTLFTANGATQLPQLNQSTIHQESFPKQSPNSNSPSYWDPNILRGMFRFS